MIHPNFKPFLGRIIVEAMHEDVEEHMKKQLGIEGSRLTLPEEYKAKYSVPLTKGRILLKSENSFGPRFEKIFGTEFAEEGRNLKVGDIVYFLPNQTFNMDPEGKIHEIADEHIMGYIKAEEYSI